MGLSKLNARKIESKNMNKAKVLCLFIFPFVGWSASTANRNQESTGVLRVSSSGEWSFTSNFALNWGLAGTAPVVTLTGGKIVDGHEARLVGKEKGFKGNQNAWRLTWRDFSAGLEICQIL